MSRPYWSARHVESLADLPEKLVRGRAYFVDDESYIVIDHGRGPVIYGGKAGPMGPSGEPQPHIQSQIDTLSDSIISVLDTLNFAFKTAKTETQNLREKLNDSLAQINDANSSLSNSVLQILNTINLKFSEYDRSIAILSNAVAKLYGGGEIPELDEEPGENQGGSSDDNLAHINDYQSVKYELGEILYTSSGSFQVNSSKLNDDGSVSLILSVQELPNQGELTLADFFKPGDTLQYNGTSWEILESDVNADEGVIIVSLK